MTKPEQRHTPGRPPTGSAKAPDKIPLEGRIRFLGPDKSGMMTALFYAFNTSVTIQAFGEEAACHDAFARLVGLCRTYERLFSRTLPHSDIARLNAAEGRELEIDKDTYGLLQAACHYCETSLGCFDITIGAAVRLWDFHQGMLPDQEALRGALGHIGWQTLRLRRAPAPDGAPACYARLADPHASLDVGGIAKGFIADRCAEALGGWALGGFIINLGGNVVVQGSKPDGSKWRIGLQDPCEKGGIVGAVELARGSAVTSGIYERCFERGGRLYHHILDPATGFPVETDLAGVTVVTERSLDAEGYSTTLLALGKDGSRAFVASHPEIIQAYFVNADKTVTTAR